MLGEKPVPRSRDLLVPRRDGAFGLDVLGGPEGVAVHDAPARHARAFLDVPGASLARDVLEDVRAGHDVKRSVLERERLAVKAHRGRLVDVHARDARGGHERRPV